MKNLNVNKRDTAEYTGKSVKAQPELLRQIREACERHHRGCTRQPRRCMFFPTRKRLTVPTLMPIPFCHR